MNTENQTPDPPQPHRPDSPDGPNPPPATSDSFVKPTGPSGNPNPQETSLSTWRHNGKVAHLPKAIRDKINIMIQDGVTYPAIIQRLGEDGTGLNVMNLSRWKDTGYQDWLLEQAFIARTRARQETPGELVRDFDATEVNHAALQLATLHIFETLRDLTAPSGDPLNENGTKAEPPLDTRHSSPATSTVDQTRNHRQRTVLDQKLGGDSAAFVRLINALARASRETMLLQKYRTACAQARAALSELKDPKRKLTESERRAIVVQVDDILGLGSPEDDEPEPGGNLPESQVTPPPAVPSSSSSLGSGPTEPPAFATTA